MSRTVDESTDRGLERSHDDGEDFDDEAGGTIDQRKGRERSNNYSDAA
jgi:hypothetical protein